MTIVPAVGGVIVVGHAGLVGPAWATNERCVGAVLAVARCVLRLRLIKSSFFRMAVTRRSLSH